MRIFRIHGSSSSSPLFAPLSIADSEVVMVVVVLALALALAFLFSL
jgi:hypothetical protein